MIETAAGLVPGGSSRIGHDPAAAAKRSYARSSVSFLGCFPRLDHLGELKGTLHQPPPRSLLSGAVFATSIQRQASRRSSTALFIWQTPHACWREPFSSQSTWRPWLCPSIGDHTLQIDARRTPRPRSSSLFEYHCPSAGWKPFLGRPSRYRSYMRPAERFPGRRFRCPAYVPQRLRERFHPRSARMLLRKPCAECGR